MQHPDERSQSGAGRPYPPLEKARERLRFFLEQRDLPPDEAGSSDVEPPLRRSLARAHARAGPPGADAAAPTGPLAADASEYSESPYLTAAREAHPKAAPRGGPPGNASSAAAAPAWQWLGPALIPRGQTFGTGPGSRPSVSGRVAAIAVDPGNRKHLLAGSAAGGVWESFDSGTTWAPRTDAQPTLAIGALAFTPANPAVVYAGTGEGNFFSRLGTGLLRSTDGGTTWALRATAPFVGTGFYDLVVDRANPNRLLAATTAMLAESTDGGAHWAQRLPQRTWSLSPGAAGEVLAACVVGLMRSTDGGTTWSAVPLPGGPARYQRLAVCQASGSPGVAYAVGADFVGGAYLWRRAAAGGAFVAEPLPPELKVANASYHWCAAVKPNDPNVLYLGSFDLHRGRRGTGGWAWGWNWGNLSSRTGSGDSIHVDQHAIAFDPADPAVIYAGNDGGVYRSANEGAGWTSLNPGLGITEFEYMAQNPGNAAWIMGGTQDNGTLVRGAGLTWELAAMGDGGDCGVNEAAPATCFHSYYSMGMERSTSGGGEGTWSAVGPAPGAGYDALFYPPLEVSGSTVAQAGQTVFVSADQGASWTEVALNAGQRVSALAVVSATRILAGTNGGRIFRLERTGAGWAGGGSHRPGLAAAGVHQRLLRRPAAPERGLAHLLGPQSPPARLLLRRRRRDLEHALRPRLRAPHPPRQRRSRGPGEPPARVRGAGRAGVPVAERRGELVAVRHGASQRAGGRHHDPRGRPAAARRHAQPRHVGDPDLTARARNPIDRPSSGGAMHSLVRTVARRDLVVRHAPALGASVVMAELFYRFHSFTLECAAFLATWYALDWAAHAVARGREPR